MSLYEYRCPSCNNEFETIIPQRNRHGTTCTRCGSLSTLLMSASNFKMAVPLTLWQAQPHGQPPKKLDSIPNSSSSSERNQDIPPDYPNLQMI